MDIFRIENDIADLDKEVSTRFVLRMAFGCFLSSTAGPVCTTIQRHLTKRFRRDKPDSLTSHLPSCRKQSVEKNTGELASLEARIREMEQLLQRSSPGTRPAITTKMDHAAAEQGQISSSTAATAVAGATDASVDSAKARSRPGTARAPQPAPSSGNMPPTPGASEGEYCLITPAVLDDASC